jgi:putative membrane protein
MRKVSILLIAVLIFALTGCQGNDPGNRSVTDNNTAQVTNAQSDDAANAVQESSTPVLNAQKPATNGEVVEITEKLFIAQLNDIYLNQGEYIGKKIKYEGMFTQYSWEETGMTYHLVYRKSPGCCGADGRAGFEVLWPNDLETYPNENDWCEVVGTLETYDENGQSYLHIVLDSLTVLETRGEEFVSQ